MATGLVEGIEKLYTCRLLALSRPAGFGIQAESPAILTQVQIKTTMELFLEFLTQQWALVAALTAVIAMLFFHESRKSGPSLTPQQAINMINREEGLFVDLRDAEAFKQGHIVGALHIPASKVESRLTELEKYKSKPIVLVCKMGQQAGAAGKQLKTEGFEQVYKMNGGMAEWSNLQLPTVK